MKLKVVRHYNYPKAMETESKGNQKPSDFFYFCFFELSNGRNISIHTYKKYNDELTKGGWEINEELAIVEIVKYFFELKLFLTSSNFFNFKQFL